VNRREFVVLAAGAPMTLRRAITAPMPAALVTCDAEARLAVVDLGSFRVLRHLPTLPDPRAIELVGRRAVVCHTAVGAVSIIEGDRVRHVLRGFEEPRYTAAHPDGRHAFVTDSGRSGVVAIDVVRGTVADPGVHPGGGVEVGVAGGHDRRHRPARGASGDVDSRRANCEVGHDLPDNARDDRQFPGVRVPVFGANPAPVAVTVRRA